GDHARTDFVNVDAVVRQAVGEELRHHRKPGLHHAVVAAVDRRSVNGDRGDVDHATAEAFSVRRLGEHLFGDQLREEIRAFQVDVKEAVEAFFARVEQVRPHLRSHTGVINEQIDAAKLLYGLRHQPLT